VPSDAIGRSAFLGKWRIVEMELWDRDYIDLEGPGHVIFERGRHGRFQFGAVEGDLDYRASVSPEGQRIEFTWEGRNDADPACGRGWATLKEGELYGYLYFHRGDESWFRATEWSRSNNTVVPDARKSGVRRSR